MEYILAIKLKSSGCPGAGHGWGGTIDTDIVYDDLGLPYIPGRRLKGILREMAEDVIKALDKANGAYFQESHLTNLFGNRGAKDTSPLIVENAYLQDYSLLRQWLLWAKSKEPQVLSRDKVLATFTHLRTHTAIEREITNKGSQQVLRIKGIAKEGSLRVIRVLNRDTEFQSEIELYSDDPLLEELLALSVQVFRSFGGKRNRGLGKVACNLFKMDKPVDKINITVLEKFKEILEESNAKQSTTT